MGVSTVNEFSTTEKRRKCCEKKWKENRMLWKNKNKTEIMSEIVFEISLKKKTKRKEKT